MTFHPVKPTIGDIVPPLPIVDGGTNATTLPTAFTNLAASGGDMGGNKLTGLANGTAATDAAAFGQIAASPVTQVRVTPNGGFALQNGTPTILTWIAPNDGAPHTIIVCATQLVTSGETGGQVQLSYTNAGGGGGLDTTFSGGSSNGTQIFNIIRTIDPNTTLLLHQTSALTAGAANVQATFWAS